MRRTELASGARKTRDMLEWMKSYNVTQQYPGSKIHYYGMDLTTGGDAPVRALKLLEPYLAQVDPDDAQAEFSETLALAEKANGVTERVHEFYVNAGEEHIPGNILDGFTSISFEQLSQSEQSDLEEGIRRLNERLVTNASTYASSSSADEYQWAFYAGILAGQMIRDLRSRQAYPVIVCLEENIDALGKIYQDPLSELTIDQGHLMKDPNDVEAYKVYFKGRETRELALAENLAWVLSLSGKTMFYAHDGHLMKTGVDIRIGDLVIGKSGAKGAGDFIAEHFGEDYVLIGGTMDGIVDETGAPYPPEVLPPDFIPTSQRVRCVEKALVEAAKAQSSGALLLDLRSSSGKARAWLEGDIDNRWEGGFQKFGPLRAFEGVFFISGVRPSRPYTP